MKSVKAEKSPTENVDYRIKGLRAASKCTSVSLGLFIDVAGGSHGLHICVHLLC